MTSAHRRWIGLVFISIAVSLIIVDSTIVNVAIPSIVDELSISSTQVQWIQESYTLVFAAFLIVSGTIADRYGRRRMLTIGIVVFALSSVFAALAPNGALLITARVFQGFGGALILPTTLSLINATFRGKERGIAFAVWGSTIGGMAALGPLLGGWLTTAFSWRWAFGINIPLGIIVLIGIVLTISESKEPDARRIDLVGALLSVLAAGTLVFGLIEGRTLGWWTPENGLEIAGATWPLPISPIPILFAVAVIGVVLFVLWGRARARSGRSSMINFELFRLSSFRDGNIVAMVVSLGEFGIIFSLPLWLQNVKGYSALQTGVLLLALAIGSFGASGFAGATSNRLNPVTIVRYGIIAEIVGIVGIGAVIGVDTRWFAIAPFLFIYGFGVGLATAQLTGVVLKDVPVELSGQASGTQSTARQVGSALGIAILGTVLFSSTATFLDHRLDDAGVPVDTRTPIVDAVSQSAGSAIPGITQVNAEAGAAAKEAFSDGTRASAFTAAGFLLIGLGASFTLGRRPEDSDDSQDAASSDASKDADFVHSGSEAEMSPEQQPADSDRNG